MAVGLSRYPSPLRYPGGKGKVANYIKLLFLQNDLLGADYVEPYAGGASVALSLLYEDFASHVHINDINVSVHAFWDAVLNHADELCDRIESTPITIDEWQRQRRAQSELPAEPSVDRAFSTFVLNRTNRSGIIGGGIIGGQEQTGPWKLDARYNVPELTRRIRKVARFRDRITLTREDAETFLAPWKTLSGPALIYLDPPYYLKGDSLYENFYEHHHHVAIAETVRALRTSWLVSYDATPEVLELYTARSIRYALSYSAQDRYAGPEVMFFSDGLVIPDEPSPAGISGPAVAHARQLSFAD